MAEFLDLSLVVQRLAAQLGGDAEEEPPVPAVLKIIDEAANSAAAMADTKGPSPRAYVLPLRDQAGANRWANATEQQVTSGFGVLLCVKTYQGAKGDAARERLTPVRNAVCAALIGWSPAAGFDPVLYQGGRLLQFGHPFMWWLDEYRTQFDILQT